MKKWLEYEELIKEISNLFDKSFKFYEFYCIELNRLKIINMCATQNYRKYTSNEQNNWKLISKWTLSDNEIRAFY